MLKPFTHRDPDQLLIDYLASVGLTALRGASLEESNPNVVWCVGFVGDDGEPPSMEFASRREVWRWWQQFASDLQNLHQFGKLVAIGCRRGRPSAIRVREWAKVGLQGTRPDLVSNYFRIFSNRPPTRAPGWLRRAQASVKSHGYRWSLEDVITQHTSSI